ncbi:MAG: hypothetical protein EPN37_01640 [Chitinophagaceae bacterium]|nr:MAG: hypothetical protein EPN37_01640 [Chitinophagaceae bacterium]
MVLSADLLKHLFNSSALDDVSDDRILSLMEQYPYFVHPHWFWAIKKWNSDHDQNDLKEAGAYTFNPFRLQQYFPEKCITPEEKDPEMHDSPGEIPTIINKSSEGETEDKPDETPAIPGENKGEKEPEQKETLSEQVIQPLFTQDYFAYTGTNLPEELVNDKKPTMEQLRSFTGWLRTMKRTASYSVDPDQDKGKVTPESGEDKYEEQEVLTETMAELRVSKGQYDKAIAIYEKLSLSNPEKSAYFAPKIEALKNK